MDRAYEGNETRQLALDLGLISVVLPTRKRLDPREYARTIYMHHSEVGHLFRRPKGFRRITLRF